MSRYWQGIPLVERIRIIRYFLPAVLIPMVVLYQLQVAFRLEEAFGHPVHYAAEVGFYSLVGPAVTWFTLIWVERRLAEKEALERQVRTRTQQLASLTEASPDAILSLDHDGQITSWNQGASDLFGYSRDEIIGHSIGEILPEAATLAGQLPGGEISHHIEALAVNRLGHTFSVELTQTQLGQTNGMAFVSLLIMRDVTVRAERAAILEEERGRISRDLHDGVAQTLYFLALKADMTKGEVTTNPDQALINVHEIGQRARQAIRDVRRAIFGLKPLNWPEGEFLPSLQKFAEDFGQEVNLQVGLKSEMNPSAIPQRLELALFRLIQESLNNVAKHAEAKTVKIQLGMRDSGQLLNLSIRDDGLGLVPKSVSRGLGLNQMKKRVAALGGRFGIRSEPGQGAEVWADFPLHPVGETHG